MRQQIDKTVVGANGMGVTGYGFGALGHGLWVMGWTVYWMTQKHLDLTI